MILVPKDIVPNARDVQTVTRCVSGWAWSVCVRIFTLPLVRRYSGARVDPNFVLTTH